MISAITAHIQAVQKGGEILSYKSNGWTSSRAYPLICIPHGQKGGKEYLTVKRGMALGVVSRVMTRLEIAASSNQNDRLSHSDARP